MGDFSTKQKYIGKSIPKTHTRWRKILGSKLAKRKIPIRLVRRIIPSDTKSMCRPPPKPPDRHNSLNDKASKRVLPYVNSKGRPLPNLLISTMPMKKGNYGTTDPLLNPLPYKMSMEKGLRSLKGKFSLCKSRMQTPSKTS